MRGAGAAAPRHYLEARGDGAPPEEGADLGRRLRGRAALRRRVPDAARRRRSVLPGGGRPAVVRRVPGAVVGRSIGLRHEETIKGGRDDLCH